MTCTWADDEMAAADFGDERLNRRAAVVLTAVGSRLNLSIPAACQGRAEMTAAYRFFDNGKVTFQKVLQPHIDQTVRRMGDQKVVLLVQDTTEIDLTRRQKVVGAGVLGGSRQGTMLHLMHAFTPDGTSLGTAWAHCINRSEVLHASETVRRKRNMARGIEEKESMRWLEGLRQSRAIAAKLPGTQCICIGDSEADIYECLVEPRGICEGGPPVHDWLIRGCYDRAMLADEHASPAYNEVAFCRIREAALSKPVLYTASVHARAREAVTGVEKRVRQQSRAARDAQVRVHAATVTLRPPQRTGHQLAPVTVNVVLVHEPDPPEGETPIEWMLLTSLPIKTLKQVRAVVEYYCVRWNIEILFRTLKSGCRIEQRRFEHIDRILPCVGLYLIATWRTLLVCRLSRECPDADCQVLFEASEWKAVWMAVHRTRPPKKTPSLSQITYLVAQLGGYVKRPNSEPGPQTIWIGMQRMHDLALAYDAFGPEARAKDV